MPRRAAPAFCNQAIQLYLPLPSPQSRTHRLINCVVYGHGLGGAPFLVHSQSHITVEAASKHPTRVSRLVAHVRTHKVLNTLLQESPDAPNTEKLGMGRFVYNSNDGTYETIALNNIAHLHLLCRQKNQA